MSRLFPTWLYTRTRSQGPEHIYWFRWEFFPFESSLIPKLKSFCLPWPPTTTIYFSFVTNSQNQGRLEKTEKFILQEFSFYVHVNSHNFIDMKVVGNLVLVLVHTLHVCSYSVPRVRAHLLVQMKVLLIEPSLIPKLKSFCFPWPSTTAVYFWCRHQFTKPRKTNRKLKNLSCRNFHFQYTKILTIS